MSFIYQTLFVLLLTLVASSTGVVMKCSYEVTSWQISAVQYSCFAFVVDTTNPGYVTDISGDHVDYRTFSDVTVFSMENETNLERIPKGIDQLFPNLISFRWVHGNLKTLSVQDLKPFSNLRLFTARENKLRSLDGDLFQATRHLNGIGLKSNNIEYVGEGLFNNLNNLTKVEIQNNTCIDFCAQEQIQVEKLKVLLLEHCSNPIGSREFGIENDGELVTKPSMGQRIVDLLKNAVRSNRSYDVFPGRRFVDSFLKMFS